MHANKDEIFHELKKVMHELFEIDPNTIQLDSNLYDALDLDSIDAVDLIAHLQTLTGRKFNPEEFKSVRLVSDVIDVIYNELNK
ncbi:MAG: hypothetical protein ACD_29C00294G0001 [uncultured bacterium]|nr:MAG: hypothetical protein ACD_29C00294G0001 [uncultured bacterium]OGT25929.1 MAG: acyl carrier protein [Gammaproteobacteria bacterium RIFCSPHIGHO2_02_FULL_42_43]OGT27372.1 MAG: acyl carrier protein [Gammaproteobacteria bacterium RIFCSPHIGHO2_01_FULL_42_8]OGT52313.1 MAG: acyl carrier protein [Gammaproteobacteria bacterium RIFCSPHIGHO2_12_FULL_41_25]OGT61925.1 MAG: acyl carrier protein [Gammaproteobacteria bacterium RIFCSPLOWO2_02_FULL_42_14]OGT86364.1 MAG: acyl carrier protein [Gammaproteoba